MNRHTTDHDVLVVGGGPAGLAAATALARSRRDVLVVDAGEPRNAPAEGAHNVLGLDGIAPRELLAKGRAELTSYGGQVREDRAVGAAEVEGGFAVELEDGDRLTARRLIVTSGVVDVLPDVPRLSRHWGGDVVHCPYCHGWEVRGRRIGVLLTSPLGMHQALLFSQLTDDLVVLTNGVELDEAARAQLVALRAQVVDGRVAEVISADDRLAGVRLEDGGQQALGAIVVASRVEVRSDLLTSLGLEVEEHPSTMGTFLPVDPMTGQTALPGVYAAGNLTDPAAQVVSAAAAGLRAGAMANMDLITTDLQERMPA